MVSTTSHHFCSLVFQRSTQFVVVNFRIVPNLPIHHVPDFLQVVWVSVYLLAIRVLKTTKPPQSTRADSVRTAISVAGSGTYQ